jgi:vacuolar-type H+-ATPase subunit B/Vma2
MFSKIFQKTTKKEEKSSSFSKFFREASSAERKKVFLDVAKQASKEQLETIRRAEMARP